MGKTHRNVYAQSDSESLYGSPHNRGFAKTLKRHSHHSIRNKNRNADEETIQNTCKHMKYVFKHVAGTHIVFVSENYVLGGGPKSGCSGC